MLRILIADDHALLRRGLRYMLEAHEGWSVCGEASDGREAVLLAGRMKPDVAVVDLLMPELHGLEATRRIREISPATAVLVLAGSYSERMEEDCASAGARGLVLKSSAEDRVVVAIEALARSETYFVREAAPAGGERTEHPGPRPRHKAAGLTTREIEVARLLAEGKTNWRIATLLGISIRTVETHRANLMQKLRLRSLVELVHYAVRNLIIEPVQPPSRVTPPSRNGEPDGERVGADGQRSPDRAPTDRRPR